MKLSFKPNTYNALDGITRDDHPIDLLWVVECESAVAYNAMTKKNKLNVRLLDEDQIETVVRLEALVTEQYKELGFISSLKDHVLNDTNIPTQYGHIVVPMQTVNKKRLLVEHVIKGLRVRIKITPTHVWKSKTSCGIIWSITDILANINYE
jgi:hypothetical protein|tara:strand:+ start:6150 stop:6605 length:456 start_codon:yes stop_codon:yes gene_type:complete